MFHSDLRVADCWLDDTSRQCLSYTCRRYRNTIHQVVFETHDRTAQKQDEHVVHVWPYVWVSSVGYGHHNAGCLFPPLGSLVVLDSYGAYWTWAVSLEPDCPNDYKYAFCDDAQQATANAVRVEKHKRALLVGLAALRRRLLVQFPAWTPCQLPERTTRQLTRSEVGQIFHWRSFWDKQRWDPTAVYVPLPRVAAQVVGDDDKEDETEADGGAPVSAPRLPDVMVERLYDGGRATSAVVVPCEVYPVQRRDSAHHCQTVQFAADMAEIPHDWYRQQLTAFALSLPRDRFRIEVLTYPLFQDATLYESYLKVNRRAVERDSATHRHVTLRDDLSMRLGVCCSSC
jgi:hypothetical protein